MKSSSSWLLSTRALSFAGVLVLLVVYFIGARPWLSNNLTFLIEAISCLAACCC
jgi:hypothetical protein